MPGINDLIGPVAAVLLIAISLAVIHHQTEVIRGLEAQRAELERQVKSQAETIKRADAEAAQLSRRIQALRKQATKTEDQLNGKIKQSKDACLNSRVDPAILDLLRKPAAAD